MFLYVKYLLAAACFTFAVHPLAPSISHQPKGRKYFESRGDAVWELPVKQKVIALTFDDGPDPKQTPEILKLLQQYNAKATFFVIGEKVREYPEIALREAAEGHELANHTFNHIFIRANTSDNVIHDEIKKTERTIFKITGQQSLLFRPPGGNYNERIIKIAKDEGNLVVMWSWHQDTKDWRKPGVQAIVRKVLTNARNGDIVLFHDHVGGKSQTIAALRRILPELKKSGYRFVTVSELLQISGFIK